MKRMQKVAILLSLLDEMDKNGSWCGETHIQKAAHHLQEAENADLGFDFILYKHGPFSFDLRDELTSIRADGLIDLKVNPIPYGPSLIVTKYGKEIIERFPKTLGENRRSIDQTAQFIGDRCVAELERLGTALFITKEEGKKSVHDRAEIIHELKPHVSVDEATEALNQIDQVLNRKELAST